ncbi:MAG TPA: GAF domain-containing protein [Gemmatimonadaceae bacterium]|jgi:GAF domain-containing protein
MISTAVEPPREERPLSGDGDTVTRLHARISELERERDHLVAVVDILTEISASLHFVDILQTIARKLGDTFGLDRCSIFLLGDQRDVRLMASYEEPAISNLIVDLDRYPELRRAFDSGETVFIPDAAADPMLQRVETVLALRNVRSIVVVPIRWRGTVIGAIFLRTERDGSPFSDRDIRFCQVVAALTANALRNAHRFEALQRGQKEAQRVHRQSELQRIALLAFVRRLLDRYTKAEDHMWAETLLAPSADEELERLVSVTLEVVGEEAKS